MGQIFSRKKPSTSDILEEIDKEIESLEEYRRSTEQRHKRLAGTLIFYSVVLYVVGAIATYFYWRSDRVGTKVLLVLPFVFFPFLVWGIKLSFQWFFRRKLAHNLESLTELRKKKRTILNDVKETETFKKATEILEKFDPEYKKQQREKEELLKAKLLSQSTPHTLRHRAVGGKTPPPSAQRGGGTPPRVPFAPPTALINSMNGQNWQRPPGPPLPRPVLPREAGVLDRVVDYLVGDGPSNRYALICQRCLSHNGMAMKEEFEFIAFRCCYCFYLNPARKLRPFAPRLPEAPIEEPNEKSIDGSMNETIREEKTDLPDSTEEKEDAEQEEELAPPTEPPQPPPKEEQMTEEAQKT